MNIFDAFYSRLLLRDIFGKIIPGSVVLFAIYVSFTSFTDTAMLLSDQNFWFWLFVLGASWITAFSFQGLGESLGWIRYYPKDMTLRDFFILRTQFDLKATDTQRQQAERIVVVKEACGNGYLSVTVASLLLVIDALMEVNNWSEVSSYIGRHWHVFTVAIILVFFLAQMHFNHVKRIIAFMRECLDANKNNGTNKTSANNELNPKL